MMLFIVVIYLKFRKPHLDSETLDNIPQLIEKEKHFRAIDQWIKEDKRYLDSNLKLESVARSVHLSEKQVSSAVNTISCQNFNSYINKLRVTEAKRLLLDPSYNHYTIEAFAEMVGFSNKVSFYKAFKKVYEQSPAELKKSQNH